MYTERQEYTLMGVSTTVGCRKLTSHWSPMYGRQKLQTYIYIKVVTFVSTPSQVVG